MSCYHAHFANEMSEDVYLIYLQTYNLYVLELSLESQASDQL